MVYFLGTIRLDKYIGVSSCFDLYIDNDCVTVIIPESLKKKRPIDGSPLSCSF